MADGVRAAGKEGRWLGRLYVDMNPGDFKAEKGTSRFGVLNSL